jgi:type IV pilus assembly protein PilE
LSLTNLTATTFTLNATPAGPQVGDPCGTYTYTELGVKDVVGATKPAAECWK